METLDTLAPSAIRTAFGATGHLLATLTDRRAAARFLKPLAATGFVATALAAGALKSPYGRCVLVALLLCMAGDVLLIPRGTGAWFRAGIAAFLLGHSGYLIAFTVHGVSPLVTLLAAGVLGPTAWLVHRRLKASIPSCLTRPGTLYVAVLTAMVVLASGAASAGDKPTILLGALMFFASDLAVARARFGSKHALDALWGTPLYFGGQFLLATTVALPPG